MNKQIVFCHTDYDRPQYHDFFNLVKLSGYPLINVNEVDPADDSKIFIITPLDGQWNMGWPDARATLVHWDLEWRLQGEYPRIPGITETWSSDSWYAMRTGTRYVTLGSHPDLPLYPLPEQPNVPKWDVAFLGYFCPRRAKIADELTRMGVSIAPNAWNPERHNILTHTRAILHVHQWEGVKCIAPQRWAIAAAYKLPIFSEECYSFDVAHPTFAIAPYGELAAAGHRVTQHGYEDTLRYFSERLYQHLCIDRNFRHNVDAAVEALERHGVV